MKRAATYEGAPCRTCGDTTRYVSSKTCRACNIASSTAYRVALSEEERRRRARIGNLRRYKLTPEQYEAMFAAQGRACAICGTQSPAHKNKWHVDHDHETGAVRGILCGHCNAGLGYFRDSYLSLVGAFNYLYRANNGAEPFVDTSEWMLHL